MENTRLILFVALSMLGLMLWEAWQADYHAVAVPPEAAAISQNQATPASIAPVPVATEAESSTVPIETRDATTERVSIRTDVYDLDIDPAGAGLVRAALRKYPISLDHPNIPVELLGQGIEKTFVLQGGLTGDQGLPNHRQLYQCDQTSYELLPGEDELIVRCALVSAEALTVEKTYRFQRNSYLVELDYVLRNNTDRTLKVHHYEQLQRNQVSSRQGMVYTFTGPVLSTPEKRFEKFDYDDLAEAPLAVSATDAWVGIIQHYFVTSLLPPPAEITQFYSKIVDRERYLVGHIGPAVSVAPGASVDFESQLFIGPKRHDLLQETAPGMELAVDYGMLWFIAKPLFSVLQYFHDLTGNWAWAIIILTFLLKLMFYPLSAAGYRSMANMRRVQPKMLAMRERYAEDRAQLNQAMMNLYKEEKINPLGGCLPILIQIPVFIALYWVLLETVEMRQAPFILWIKDLSSKDPFFVLPLLMGISMWIQQKLNPAPLDPMQAKVMQLMPIIFTVFFAFFPSGLVLYWVVNNVLSIAQQWRITKVIESQAR